MRATGLLFLASMMVGCAARSTAEPEPALADPIPAPFTPRDDAEFLDAMAPHLRAGIQMTRHVVENGSDPDVLRIAGEILATQLRETREVQRLRAGLPDAPRHPVEADPRTRADIRRLNELSGPALDRAFLRAMIAQHASGIQLAHRASPHLTAPVRGLAQRMLDRQADQTGDMRDLLIELTDTASASSDRAQG